MGFWGYGIFSGDAPLDEVANVEKLLEERIIQRSKEKRGIGETLALIHIYANFLSQYGKNSKKLKDFIKHIEKELEPSKLKRWAKPKERKGTLNKFIKYIKNNFEFDKRKGYKSSGRKVKLEGKYVYHLTKEKHVRNIKRKGLTAKKPNCGFIRNRKGIYVSNSFFNCLRWKHHVCGYLDDHNPAIIRFKVKKTDTVYEDKRVEFKGDYVITNNISPGRLKIFY